MMCKQAGIILCPYLGISLLPSEFESELAGVKQEAFEGQPGSSVPFREALLLQQAALPARGRQAPELT